MMTTTASVTFKVIHLSHPLRQEVERYIASRYAVAFEAQITEFMPTFLAVYSEQNELLSVCGYRIASQEPLFLEQYLPTPAEQTMEKQFAEKVKRETLIEFGQLASFSNGISPIHFLLMTQHLVEQGFEWCIFTATDPLYAMMVRLGLQPTILAIADKSLIANAQETWGTYYRRAPRVSAGNLKLGLTQLISRYEKISARQSRAKIS